MARKLFKKHNISLHLRFVILTILCAGLLIGTCYYSLPKIRRYLVTGSTPLLAGAQFVKSSWTRLNETLTSNSRAVERINELRADKLSLTARVQQLQQLQQENRHLKHLMQYHDESGALYHLASIVKYFSNNHIAWIDQGYADDLAQDELVFDGTAVIGVVWRVYEHFSEAILLSHPHCAISVRNARSGVNAIAIGDGKNKLKLVHVPHTADIKMGDLFVTSSLGSEYPEGYHVARVENVIHKPGSEFVTVKLRPVSSAGRSNRVLLIKSEKGTL